MKKLFAGRPFVTWGIIAIIVSLIFRSLYLNIWVWIFSLCFALYQFHKNTNVEKLRNQAQEYVDAIKKNKSLSIIPSSTFLNENEHLFLKEDRTRLIETRSVRHGGGGFGSIRVAKGVRIGGYSGKSESSQE